MIDGSKEAALALVQSWFDLAADGRLRDACDLLDLPTSYGEVWTPESVLSLLRETFTSNSGFGMRFPEGPRFSRLAETVGDPHLSFGDFADGSGFWIDHLVPLNGEYSDLTAQFEFRRREEGYCSSLESLHVL